MVRSSTRMEKNNRLRILNILGGSKDGGAEKFFERLAIGIEKKRGISQKLIIRKNSSRFSFLNSFIKDINEIKYFYFFNPFCHFRIKKIINEFKPNIILTWMNRASRILPRDNNSNFRTVGRLGGYYKIKNYVNCDYLITNTLDLKRYVLDFGWDQSKVEFIPNFVNKNNNSIIKSKSEKKIVLCMGRFHKNKGIDLLLKGMTFLPNHELWIVGKGKEREHYDNVIKKQKIENRVFFFEWTNNVSQYLNSADVLVCPSRHEPFGNVIVDGWAHKLPVVVSDVGGPRVIVKNKINGLKFRNEDYFDLVEQINKIDKNIKLKKKIIKNGFDQYKSLYSEEIIIDKYINFFKKISK